MIPRRRDASREPGRAEEKEAASGGERTLAGLLTESLGEAVVAAQGKPPRWLAYGFGGAGRPDGAPRAPRPEAS